MTDTAPMLKSRAFREAREDEWRKLERLLGRLDKGSLDRLSDDDLVALPALYRSTLSALSTARAVSLDRALIDYLESLCTRAYFAIYGVRVRPLESLVRFLVHDWPEAARRLWRETSAAGVLMGLGTLVGYLLTRSDPQWFYAFVEGGLAGGRGPEASAASLREVLYKSGGTDMLTVMSSFLFTHNAQIALFAFALGFALCVPTGLLVTANGATLGALVAVYDAKGLAPELWGWILIHGVTELFAICLSGAAGFRIGMTILFPGDRDRTEALAEEGRRAATLMAGVVIMLMVAGLLEGFARQLITSDLLRYGVAAATACLWGGYYYGPAIVRLLSRRAAAG